MGDKDFNSTGKSVKGLLEQAVGLLPNGEGTKDQILEVIARLNPTVSLDREMKKTVD